MIDCSCLQLFLTGLQDIKKREREKEIIKAMLMNVIGNIGIDIASSLLGIELVLWVCGGAGMVHYMN